MTEQLAMELAPERLYTCCGRPCAPLSAKGDERYAFPHAEDCPNPNVGTWFDRFGRPLRRLWCGDDVRMGKRPCPNGRPADCCKRQRTEAWKAARS